MRSLTVLYDAGCPLCRWVTGWLRAKPQLIELRFVPAGSREAKTLYPALDHQSTLDNITVVSDEGDVFRNEKAWLMCLWALPEYRKAAVRLSRPSLMPLAKRFVRVVSKYRPQELKSLSCEDGRCDV